MEERTDLLPPNTPGATISNLEADQEIHDYLESEMLKENPHLIIEKTIGNVKPDAYDLAKLIIYEIRPNNPEGIRLGNIKLNKCKKTLAKLTDTSEDDWTTQLLRY